MLNVEPVELVAIDELIKVGPATEDAPIVLKKWANITLHSLQLRHK